MSFLMHFIQYCVKKLRYRSIRVLAKIRLKKSRYSGSWAFSYEVKRDQPPGSKLHGSFTAPATLAGTAASLHFSALLSYVGVASFNNHQILQTKSNSGIKTSHFTAPFTVLANGKSLFGPLCIRYQIAELASQPGANIKYNLDL